MCQILFLIFLNSFSYSVTLKEAYQLAHRNMESLKRADAQLEQSKENKIQARAIVLPSLNLVGNLTQVEPPNNAGRSPFLLTRQYSTAIRLNQSLIRGGAIGALKLAEENVLLSQFQKSATEVNLYRLVIDAYFSLASAQYDVKNLEDSLKLSRERVAEIKARSKIGRSRKGELIEAEAQLHTAESQLKNGQLELDAAKKNFTFLTLTEPENIVLGDLPQIKESLAAFQTKLNSRPDVLASKHQVQMAHTQVEISKGGHYPSLDLISNYYLERTGVLASSKWDAALVYTVPIYQGGGVSSQIREAVEAKRTAELTNHEYIRTAERDMAIQYQNYSQILEQLKSLKQARDKAEEAYRLSLKDYDLGLITNLDVLQSLNFYVTTERNYDGLFVLGHLAYHNLEAAAGVIP